MVIGTVAAALVAAGLGAGTAGPALQVSQVADLAEGQQITVAGSGYRPGLQSVAVGLCREGYTNGLKDCDLGGGATFVNIDAKGRFSGVRLKARSKFNGIDCTARQCVIGAAPLPTSNPPAVVNANTAVVRVGFKGSTFTGGTTPAPAATTAAPSGGGGGPSTVLWAVTAGAVVVGGATIAARQRRR
ncbi:hypothetical protein J4573_12190 [Actinomadura barringtoniae]|uniref:Neocarzinostatin n=1 Tax=Actinomadura barringtoniae TaxID=1427535 RepID=A0A939PDU1_9ACTN|nr:neocarzinostatin apoprotein domain-containing protein [Actinomadura barringtoniae]MBO2447854.1 hypothetical protein [Actinomadura barringtoniae]